VLKGAVGHDDRDLDQILGAIGGGLARGRPQVGEVRRQHVPAPGDAIWPAVEPPVVSALILVCSAALSLVSGTIAAAGQAFPLGGVGAAHLIGRRRR
jgi:hypothetical protein